jgi:hypothetical protein
MKKTHTANRSSGPDKDLLPEYRFDYSKARRNRFATRIKQSASWRVPLTEEEFLSHIVRETARMSYPGSMSRRKTVLKGTKAALECFFVDCFPIAQVWHHSTALAKSYDEWHKEQSHRVAESIKPYVPPHNNAVAVGTKFLNTFMHQLMKYEPCRGLWRSLHLPLDSRAFSRLAKLRVNSLSGVQQQFSKSPYKLEYESYIEIQQSLWEFVKELNARPGTGWHLTSRIELNWLWL